MAHYRTLVATVNSAKYDKGVDFTLPNINSQDCDVHYVETEKFLQSPIFRLILNLRKQENPNFKQDPFRRQTILRMIEQNRFYPVPMPYAEIVPARDTINLQFDPFAGDVIWMVLQLQTKGFNFCIKRNGFDPEEISAVLGTYRPPEPASEWEVHEDIPFVRKDEFTYRTSDSHLLQTLAEHYTSTIKQQAKLENELLKIRFTLRNKPEGYEDACQAAKTLRDHGIDPALEPGLAWNTRPTILAYRKLMAEEAKLAAMLTGEKIIERCRNLLDLMHSIGELAAHIPEPDDVNKHFSALESRSTIVDSEITNPKGEALELLRRFNLMDNIIATRREEVWTQAIDEEQLTLLNAMQVILAHAIERDSAAAELARTSLATPVYTRLEKILTEPESIFAKSSTAFLFGSGKSAGMTLRPGM